MKLKGFVILIILISAILVSLCLTACKIEPEGKVIGSYTSPTHGHIASIEIVGDYAFTGEWGYGIRILDISDPESITQAGKYEMDLSSGMDHEMKVSGNYLFIADPSNCFTVLDISDIANPVFADSYTDIGCSGYGLDIEGTYAFMADGVNGLVVLDILNPDSVGFCDSLDDETYLDQMHDVDVVGNYAYTISRVGQFAVIDVSDKFNLQRKGTNANIAPITEEIVVNGNYAYVADNLGGLRIFDISNPDSPSYISSLEIGAMSAESVCFSGGDVYVLDAVQSIVYQVDVSDPENPEDIASFESDGYIIDDICVSDGLLYVSGMDGTVEVVQL